MQLRRGAEWVPIDLPLATRPDGTIAPVAAPHDLPLTSTGPVARWAGDGSTALAPVAPGPGTRATCPRVTPGYDLVVEATRAGFAASTRRAGPRPGPRPSSR